MGITIHYKGKLEDKTQVPSLIDELQDIAEVMTWSWNTIDEDWS